MHSGFAETVVKFTGLWSTSALLVYENSSVGISPIDDIVLRSPRFFRGQGRVYTAWFIHIPRKRLNVSVWVAVLWRHYY